MNIIQIFEWSWYGWIFQNYIMQEKKVKQPWRITPLLTVLEEHFTKNYFILLTVAFESSSRAYLTGSQADEFI